MVLNSLKTSANMDKNRLFWAARRGMLELDLVLEPFLQKHYDALDKDDKALFETLLEEQDQDLFQWFMRKSDPESEHLLRIVNIIRSKTGIQE